MDIKFLCGLRVILEWPALTMILSVITGWRSNTDGNYGSRDQGLISNLDVY